MAERLQIIAGHVARSPCNITCNDTSAQASVSSLGHYRYTAGSPLLSAEQRQHYEDHGFLVIRKLVPSDKIERYRKRFEEICRGKIAIPGMTVMKDIAIETSEYVPGEKAVAKLQDFQNDDGLFHYCLLPEVVKYVESIIGPDIVGIHTMFINKPPDTGVMTSRHPMHQDLHYFPFRPPDQIVCSWTAMQTVNRQNGCLVVVPGSHKGTLLTHEYPKWEGGVNKLYHGIQDYDPSQERVYLEMEVGDTVFFHPLLIHGSGTNKTKDFRKSISCHYASGNCYVEDVSKDSLYLNEIGEMVKRRTGQSMEELDLKLDDLWKFKSRTVQGKGFI